MSRVEQLMAGAGVFGDVDHVLVFCDPRRFDPEFPLDEDHAISVYREGTDLQASQLIYSAGAGQSTPVAVPELSGRFATVASVDTGEQWMIVAVICPTLQEAQINTEIADARDVCVVDLDSGRVRRRRVTFT